MSNYPQPNYGYSNQGLTSRGSQPSTSASTSTDQVAVQLGHPALEYEDGVSNLRQKVKLLKRMSNSDSRGNERQRQTDRFVIGWIRFRDCKFEESEERVGEGVQTSESGALVSADVFCSRVVLVPVHGVQSEQIRALVFTKGKARVDFR